MSRFALIVKSDVPSHIKIMYRCPGCESCYDEYDDAVYCCRPRIKKIFICKRCKKNHEDEDIAKKCCIENYSPSAIELEAAGQESFL
jgi:hypothetical protein